MKKVLGELSVQSRSQGVTILKIKAVSTARKAKTSIGCIKLYGVCEFNKSFDELMLINLSEINLEIIK